MGLSNAISLAKTDPLHLICLLRQTNSPAYHPGPQLNADRGYPCDPRERYGQGHRSYPRARHRRSSHSMRAHSWYASRRGLEGRSCNP